MNPRTFALLLALATVPAVGTFVTSDAQAAATGPATTFIQTKYDAVIKLLGDKASPEREKKIDAALAELIDYDEMAKQVLGDEAGKHSGPEVAKFTSVLKELIQIAYKKKINDLQKWNVSYTAEVPQGSDIKVQTEAKNGGDKKAVPVVIEYVVRKKGTGYIVVDIVPEDASYVKTYNKELMKVVKKDGWDAMMKKLDDKLAKEKSGKS